MRLGIILILIGLCSFSVEEAYAQHKHKMRPYFKGRYKAIKVSRAKKKTICPGYNGAAYPYQTIGFKLGDPIALAYKMYVSKRWALSIDYGRTATGLYGKFHRQNFVDAQQDTLGVGEQLRYFGHSGKKDGIFTGKIEFISEFKRVKGLQWFIGVGAQYRWSDIEFVYIEEVANSPNELKTYNLNYFTLGPSAVLGIEYMHPDIPIASFFEVESFFDTFNSPGWIRLSAGVGLRYVLK